MKKVLFLLAISAIVFPLKSDDAKKSQPSSATSIPPFFAVSPSTNTNAASLFQNINIDHEQQRKRMQYSAEYNRLNFQIAERMQQLFEENEELKKMRKEICDLQEKIDKILQEDAELKALYEKQKNLLPSFPAIPSATPAKEDAGKEKHAKDAKSSEK